MEEAKKEITTIPNKIEEPTKQTEKVVDEYINKLPEVSAVDEIFMLSEIVDCMEFELPAQREKETQTQYGTRIFTSLFAKLYKAPDAVKKYVKVKSGKDPDKMSFKDLKEAFTNIVRNKETMDFFK